MLKVKDKCTGCGVCAVSCPTKSIQMLENKEGFRFPVIDKNTCIECYLCERKCPVLNEVVFSSNTNAYAVKNKCNDIRRESSSGGVFSVLAESILADGGTICAAKYNEEFLVTHGICDSVDMLFAYRGAKYAQSQSERYFPDIKRKLDYGENVMFVGTPCQVAALVSYLEKDYPKLYLVDMICHGVPSPEVWKKYLGERCYLDGNNLKINHVNLRSKATGWSRYGYSVEISYQSGECYSVCQSKDPFMRGFTSNLYLRKSCSQCGFKGIERCSDFTLGDYWGIWEQYPEFDDNKGVSVLLIHSEKGRKKWENIAHHFELKEVSVEEAVQYNPSVLKNSLPHPMRDKFFKRWEEENSIITLIETLLINMQTTKESLIKRIAKHFIS